MNEASHAEEVFQTRDAAKALRRLQGKLRESPPPFETPSGLFLGDLQRLISWHRKPEVSDQLVARARAALDAGLYVRACTVALEAAVARQLLAHGLDVANVGEDDRKDAKRVLREDPVIGEPFRLLNTLRNAMVHGDRPKSKSVVKILANPKRLRHQLQTIFSTLEAWHQGDPAR